MIFGSNPTYLYGEVFKEKFSTPENAYKITPLPVECAQCPARLVNGSIEIFFAGSVFNTYVTSDEERVSVLKSFDDKPTIIKKKQPKNVLLTVKIVREDEKVREVELYRFCDLYPGYKTSGAVELVHGKRIIHTKRANGEIVLQNNIQRPVTECLLYKVENNEYFFVEINNPVERCTVKVVKDMRTTKIVSNDNIKGVLLDCKSNRTDVDVFVKRTCLGSYIFVEDIKEGTATVKLLEKENGVFKVSFKGFIGDCMDPSVSGTMKGTIYDIEGATFKFRQSEDHPEKEADAPAHKRSLDFEEVEVFKNIKIESEDQIGSDQFKAIDYIKNRMKKEPNVLPLINKYVSTLSEKDQLCLFYLEYLEGKDMLSLGEVSKMLKTASPGFHKLVVAAFDRPDVLRFVYKKKKSKACFVKLLGLAEDKTAFIKENREFTDFAIEYIYQNLENPRVLVESIIDSSLKSWTAYLRHETGSYKRSLFRRLVKNSLRKDEAKSAFKMWLEFEESVNGNVDEVKEQAKAYVSKQK